LAKSSSLWSSSNAVHCASDLPRLGDEAIAHHQAGRFGDAIALYQQILVCKADIAEVHNNLGHALAALGRHEPAVAAFARAIALKPHNPEALCNWGLSLAELDRLDEAEAKYRQAIAIDPHFPGACNNLGLLLKERGRLSEAEQAFERAIELAPQKTPYYENLAALRPFTAGDRYFTALQALAEPPATLPVADRISLHFALAKAYDDTGHPELAFPELVKANACKRRHTVYDEAETIGMMDRLRALIGSDFIAARRGRGLPSQVPVFIVGMTRSGTTLIEQILASHPKVFGAGELSLLDQVAGAVRTALPGSPPFPDMMLEMSPQHFRALGELYLESIVERAPDALRITDKMTVNFLFVGLIHLILPNATIIHAVRDPVDTCMSCFATHFTRAHPHTYDLAELGRYYLHYRRLMAHWHEVLPPGAILDVHYEDMVADVEGVSRRIVAHCGLEWDARCLDFHRSARPIRTASAAQVRKPIYQGAVQRWRKYEAFLEPLLAELAPVLAA
jgi:Flp pilus assembly protein TadD